MTDLSTTIDPKSDQLNADDLIAGPRTITITRVVGNSDKDQPISIFFEGDKGKPYKPCKSMRRVLVQLWGKDGGAYTGRAMTLYRDPKVKFGDIECGGVRISHLSHIESDIQLVLTATRGKKAPHQVRRLANTGTARPNEAAGLAEKIAEADSLEVLRGHAVTLAGLRDRKAIPGPEYNALATAIAARKAELQTTAAPPSDTNGDVDGYGEPPEGLE